MYSFVCVLKTLKSIKPELKIYFILEFNQTNTIFLSSTVLKSIDDVTLLDIYLNKDQCLYALYIS
jgi:hypothetical protein